MKSIWYESCKFVVLIDKSEVASEKLKGYKKTDIVIVGSGITGMQMRLL